MNGLAATVVDDFVARFQVTDSFANPFSRNHSLGIIAINNRIPSPTQCDHHRVTIFQSGKW